jgi:fructose-specific component phosphotransferase system IIB-like protein
MFIVVYKSASGFDYFLRGTVWSGGRERAIEHPTEEAAREALKKAKPFTKRDAYKAARVVPASDFPKEAE